MNEPILRVESLAKRFGGLEALGGVDLAVARGEFRADVATGAGTIVHDHLMTPALGEFLAHHPRQRVGRAAW